MKSPLEERLPKNEQCEEIFKKIAETLESIINELPDNPKHQYKNKNNSQAVSKYNSEDESQETNDKQSTAQIITSLTENCTREQLEKTLFFVEGLIDYSLHIESKISVKKHDYLEFIMKFGENSLPGHDPIESLEMMFGSGMDQSCFESAILKIFNIIFLRQAFLRISFYELSLLSTLLQIQFKHDLYLNSLLSKASHCFVYGLCSLYTINSRYIMSRSFLDSFANKVVGLINTFNGILKELGIVQECIPKIVFTMLIFTAEKQSFFMKKFGDTELLYCSIRAFKSGDVFAKKLESFLKTKVFLEFTCEKADYVIDKVFQTIYKYEFKRFIGSLTQSKNKLFISTPMKKDLLSDRSIGVQKAPFTTNVVNETPKINKHKAVKAFSPFSQRIGEASGIRDDFDSKRKLNFD